MVAVRENGCWGTGGAARLIILVVLLISLYLLCGRAAGSLWCAASGAGLERMQERLFFCTAG